MKLLLPRIGDVAPAETWPETELFGGYDPIRGAAG